MIERGIVNRRWFDDKKGYGLIERHNCGDVFVHYKSIKGTGHRTMNEGESVTFIVEQTAKGCRRSL
jgi:CspA family cold shock protein